MHLLQAGVNLIYIRDLLGHADVSTTEIYARADAEAKRKAIESAYQSLTPEAPGRLDSRPRSPRMARPLLRVTHPGYVAGTSTRGSATSGDAAAGHITQPST